MDNKIKERFLSNTDHTGRFMITSKVTGVSYYVEPVGNPRTNWGDLDPATKKVTGSYGTKYRGSVDEKDSIVTEENGFKNVVTLPPGQSPLDYIYNMDAKREADERLPAS